MSVSQTEEEHEGNGHHLHCCAVRCRQEPAAPPPDSARLGAVFTVTSTLVQVDAVVTDSRSGTLIYTMHATGLQTLQLDAQDRPTLAGGADAPLNRAIIYLTYREMGAYLNHGKPQYAARRGYLVLGF